MTTITPSIADAGRSTRFTRGNVRSKARRAPGQRRVEAALVATGAPRPWCHARAAQYASALRFLENVAALSPAEQLVHRAEVERAEATRLDVLEEAGLGGPAPGDEQIDRVVREATT